MSEKRVSRREFNNGLVKHLGLAVTDLVASAVFGACNQQSTLMPPSLEETHKEKMEKAERMINDWGERFVKTDALPEVLLNEALNNPEMYALSPFLRCLNDREHEIPGINEPLMTVACGKDMPDLLTDEILPMLSDNLLYLSSLRGKGYDPSSLVVVRDPQKNVVGISITTGQLDLSSGDVDPCKTIFYVPKRELVLAAISNNSDSLACGAENNRKYQNRKAFAYAVLSRSIFLNYVEMHPTSAMGRFKERFVALVGAGDSKWKYEWDERNDQMGLVHISNSVETDNAKEKRTRISDSVSAGIKNGLIICMNSECNPADPYTTVEAIERSIRGEELILSTPTNKPPITSRGEKATRYVMLQFRPYKGQYPGQTINLGLADTKFE